MSYNLQRERKISILKALVDGASIRATERMVGVHRDTIMRLSNRVGRGAGAYMDRHLVNLECDHIQVDEIWGFVGKKQANASVTDKRYTGDVYTFVALDTVTKLIPTYRLGRRTIDTALPFLQDLAGRMAGRIQLSSDGLRAYYEAVLCAFGKDVDYGIVLKNYVTTPKRTGQRYFPGKIVKVEQTWAIGFPITSQICTSHIERQNLNIRLFVRRLTRLTNAFSKRIENMVAALALYFMHYNFVRIHGTLKTTPAVAAGIERAPWSMDQLLEATV